MSTLVPLTFACILSLTSQHGFPRETMFSLLMQEAGHPGAEVANRDKSGRPWSHDLGPYQVNSQHVPTFARLWGVDEPTAYRLLRDDGCANARAAAHLLAEHWRRTGDIWTAIGHYHSRTEKFASAYKQKVYEKTVKLYNKPKEKKGK